MGRGMGWEGRDGNLGFWGQPVAALILALGLRFWAEPMVLMVVPWLPLVESWVLMASAVLTTEGTAELCLGRLLRLFMLCGGTASASERWDVALGSGEESAQNNWATSCGDACMDLAMGEPLRFLPGLRNCDLGGRVTPPL